MNTPLAIRKVNIFEVVNHTRRESLIAVTSEDSLAFRRRLSSAPPDVIGHWDCADQTEFEPLAVHLGPGTADHFLKLFMSDTRMRDWRLIEWRCTRNRDLPGQLPGLI
ncbi:MAG: hypothetical protein A2V88_00535 [Elusimicrobia bacterium RBG_16_66_12]|nr:MAG: hypothetical protein A2V88_00535 [Elusimicrobia bacterium RBG_16_66_12]